MSHIVGHSHRKDLQDLRHLPRAPVLSYMQKQAVPRAPRVKTPSMTDPTRSKITPLAHALRATTILSWRGSRRATRYWLHSRQSDGIGSGSIFYIALDRATHFKFMRVGIQIRAYTSLKVTTGNSDCSRWRLGHRHGRGRICQ